MTAFYTPTAEERKAMIATKSYRYSLKHQEELREKARRNYAKAKQGELIGKTPKGWSLRNKEYHLRVKARAIAVLGGKCVRCGFDDIRALEADHIHGGGLRDKRSTYGRYRAIAKGESVGEFQCLCCNCNRIRQHTDGQWKGYLSR